jgi:acetyltransferase-like isoleucine patch superfamily enzyme
MANLTYLWSHRAKFPFGSRIFVRAWGKRVHSFPELMLRNWRRWRLTQAGASIAETAEIGEVVVAGHKDRLRVGAFSFLGQVRIALHGPVTIGDRVCINDGVEILTASHHVDDPQWRHKVGEVRVDDYVWIGTRAIILPGVSLGWGCVVGAGAVVTKSVPSRAIVAGNPARTLNKTRCAELDYNPCSFLAANRSWLIG